MDGFRNNIDPKIIKHPANCRLILQSENFNKKDESHLTIEQLLEKINEFNLKYDK